MSCGRLWRLPDVWRTRFDAAHREIHAIFVQPLSIITIGCATPGTSTFDYTPPQKPTKIQNETIVSKPFETVWDSFVRELAKSFYVINNIDKQSRIINVSFSTDTPETYVDCGITTHTYSRGDERQTYKYNLASASTYKMAGVNNQLPQTAVPDFSVVLFRSDFVLFSERNHMKVLKNQWLYTMPYPSERLPRATRRGHPMAPEAQRPSQWPCLTQRSSEMCPQRIVRKALSQGTSRKDA